MSTRATRSLFGAAVAVLVCFLAPGCDKDAADKQAIRTTWERLDEARNSRDGATAVSLLSAATIEAYGRTLKMGLDATKKELESLDPFELSDILLLRYHAKRKDVQGLDARGFAAYATSQGWYADKERLSIEFGKIRISGDAATAYVYDGGEPTGDAWRFVREDGVWKFEEISWRSSFNEWIRDMAAEQGVGVPEAIIAFFETEFGKPAPKTIWQPMK